jgi:hypothetical protein
MWLCNTTSRGYNYQALLVDGMKCLRRPTCRKENQVYAPADETRKCPCGKMLNQEAHEKEQILDITSSSDIGGNAPRGESRCRLGNEWIRYLE